jgi:hypothetical protein
MRTRTRQRPYTHIHTHTHPHAHSHTEICIRHRFFHDNICFVNSPHSHVTCCSSLKTRCFITSQYKWGSFCLVPHVKYVENYSTGDKHQIVTSLFPTNISSTWTVLTSFLDMLGRKVPQSSQKTCRPFSKSVSHFLLCWTLITSSPPNLAIGSEFQWEKHVSSIKTESRY